MVVRSSGFNRVQHYWCFLYSAQSTHPFLQHVVSCLMILMEMSVNDEGTTLQERGTLHRELRKQARWWNAGRTSKVFITTSFFPPVTLSNFSISSFPSSQAFPSQSHVRPR
jgi:hypothetical protein